MKRELVLLLCIFVWLLYCFTDADGQVRQRHPMQSSEDAEQSAVAVQT